MRFCCSWLLALSIPLLAVVAVAKMQTRSVGRDAALVYAEECAGCHGAHLEGGKGPALRAGRFAHGGDDAALLRSIGDGYPASGMPAFGATLNDGERRGLVAYLREQAVHAADPQPAAEDPPPTGVQHSEAEDYRIETVATGFDVPWSLAFLPDGRMLVTERVGRLRIVDRGRLEPEPVRGVPPVALGDEAGLMSVVVDPDFAHNGWVYLSFSDPGPDGSSMTKIIRGRLRDGALVEQRTIFAEPRADYPPGLVLFGGRMVRTGPYLFFSVGERNVFGAAQKLDVPYGKIHRVFADGSVPPDNPFIHTPGAAGSIWASGVRNPQGLALDPRDGALWETEHGPRGGDELNWIRPGRNYGWPAITYGINYDGTPITDKTAAPGLEQPVLHWTPSIATSEIEFYTGDRFPRWRGDLFLGSLAQQKFLRIVLDASHRATHAEEVFKHLGRIRDIKTGPDGAIYVALEYIGERGRIIRLVPAE